MQPCGGNCPTAEGQGSQKIVCFAHKLFFCHIFLQFLGSWFCIDGAVRAHQAAVRAPQGACAPLWPPCAPLKQPCAPPPRRARPNTYNVIAKDPTWQRCGSHRGQSNSGFTLFEVNMPLTLM
jgi:hypothetical protein